MSENINNARFIHITWYKITRDLAIISQTDGASAAVKKLKQ